LKEDGKEADDDKRRFKVQIQHAQEIDLDTIMDFCKKNKQTEATKEIMASSGGISSSRDTY
jgi:eukaryotic translation initiation factor 2C